MGAVEGEALVTHDLIAFWGGADWETVKLLNSDMKREGKSLWVKSWVSPSAREEGAKPSGITTLVAAEKHRLRSYATVATALRNIQMNEEMMIIDD